MACSRDATAALAAMLMAFAGCGARTEIEPAATDGDAAATVRPIDPCSVWNELFLDFSYGVCGAACPSDSIPNAVGKYVDCVQERQMVR